MIDPYLHTSTDVVLESCRLIHFKRYYEESIAPVFVQADLFNLQIGAAKSSVNVWDHKSLAILMSAELNLNKGPTADVSECPYAMSYHKFV